MSVGYIKQLFNDNILSRIFIKLCRSYGFSFEQQADLLSIKNINHDLTHENITALYEHDFVIKSRIEMIIRIHMILRTMYPHNREIVYSWMKYPQEVIGGAIPINFILENSSLVHKRINFIKNSLERMLKR